MKVVIEFQYLTILHFKMDSLATLKILFRICKLKIKIILSSCKSIYSHFIKRFTKQMFLLNPQNNLKRTLLILNKKTPLIKILKINNP